jgi:ribosomal protein L23
VNILAWLGNAARKNIDKALEKMFDTKPEEVRGVGRPKLRFEDGVNQEMKTSGVKKCKNAALDTDEWTQLLKKVKAHEGLSNQW